jgi:uncharacterized membrane protein YfcA
MVFEAASVAVVMATFFFGGSVKGVTGLGLPPIVLGVLTATIGIHPAKALILIPTFSTNIWQACVGGNGRAIVARTWPFLFPATVMIGVASFALKRVDTSLLSFLLGVVLMLYGATGLCNLRLNVPERWRHPAGLIFGTANGILTGLTGSSAVPGVFYLQSIGLNRDELLQGMGILFTLSTIGLAVSLGMQDLLTAELGVMSAVALIPAMIGMVIGQKISRGIPEVRFRTIFYASLLLLGFYNAIRNLPA